MLGDLASIGQAARTRRTGSFGELPAAAATPLVRRRSRNCCTTPRSTPSPKGSPSIIELVAGGRRRPRRPRAGRRQGTAGRLTGESDGLGLQIVRTLVASELGGGLTMTSPPPDGRARTEAC